MKVSSLAVVWSSLQLGVQLPVILHTWLRDVRGVHKSQLPRLSPCSLRLAVTSVWSSYGHIPCIESPTERTHLLCSENSLISAKLKRNQVYLQKHFGIFLQAQIQLYLAELCHWWSARPTCSSRSNAQGQVFSVFGMQPCSVYWSKMPWSLA